jgi:hypothetical protein
VIAPALDRTVSTTTYDQIRFLYNEAIPVQTRIIANTIEPKRTSELHNAVLDENGEPLSGVVITIVGHSEFGQTMSRADGKFNLVINGGGALTVNYATSGYLPIQRTMKIP